MTDGPRTYRRDDLATIPVNPQPPTEPVRAPEDEVDWLGRIERILGSFERLYGQYQGLRGKHSQGASQGQAGSGVSANAAPQIFDALLQYLEHVPNADQVTLKEVIGLAKMQRGQIIQMLDGALRR